MTDATDQAQEPDAIKPRTPTERLLYLGVILGVAAVVTVGLGAVWAVMTIQGNGDETGEIQKAFYAGLAFLFGGGIAARV